MTKIKLKYSIAGLYETLYEVELNRSHEEETSDTKHPHQPSGKPASEKQKAHRQQFKQAVAYAKAAMAEPKVRAVYKKLAARQSRLPFQAAVSDYLQGNNLLTD